MRKRINAQSPGIIRLSVSLSAAATHDVIHETPEHLL